MRKGELLIKLIESHLKGQARHCDHPSHYNALADCREMIEGENLNKKKKRRKV